MLASRPTILVPKKSIAGFLLSVSRTGFAKLLKHLHPPPIRTSYAFCDYSPRLPSVCLFFPLFLLLPPPPPPPPLRSSSNIHLLLVSFPSSSFSVSIEMPTRQRSMCLSCISIRDLSHYCIYILRIAISVCISIYLFFLSIYLTISSIFDAS